MSTSSKPFEKFTYAQFFKDDLHAILDTMTGADGGVEFCYFNWKMQDFAKMIDENSGTEHDIASAKELLMIVNKFRKLIEALQPK